MSKFSVYIFSFLIIVLHTIQAQDKIDTTFQSSVAEIMKNKPKEEENMVTSATKTEQSLAEAPNLLSVVQRRQFIDLGYVSLNNIVWNLPGFSISRDYDRYAISSRGNFENWNNNHLLMLVDGIPFNESIYGSAMTSEVTPLVFIKSVEVMRGAGSALYGTNAMNGLLNIKTISPSDLKGNVEARTRITANGTQIYDAIAGVNHDRLSLVAAFNHYYTIGNNYESYDASGSFDTSGNLQKFTIKDRRESSYFFAKADFKGKFTGLSFQYHEHLWNYQTGHGWAFQISDQDEVLRESRRILALTYKTPIRDNKINYEFVLRYQLKGIDWDMRLLPDSAKLGNILYPNGLSERVKTNIDDVFTRIQTSYQLKNKTLLLAGLENTFLYYTGDNLHTSNVAISNTFLPNPNNTFKKLNGYLEYMQNHLVINTGVFAQYISPKFIAQRMTITAGLRLDNQLFNYTDITQINRPTLSKSFTQLNPRLSLVFKTTEKLYLKAMFGRAFRTPSPAEIFSANTYAVASNIKQLQPENVDSFEFSADYNANKKLFMRLNGYYTAFGNLIGYSIQNNALATNLYSTKTIGFEIETTYNDEKFTAFANYGFAKRLSEVILDTTILESKEVTWVPAHTAKIGATYRIGKFYVSVVANYQGTVLRRNSDNLETSFNGNTVDVTKYRPNNVAAFINVDTKIGFKASKNFEFGCFISNLLNTEAYTIKNFAYPMDYRLPLRAIMFDIKFVY